MMQQKTSNILGPLNEKQKEAVLENDNNLLIIAGAGSGKTKTITHKIAYILENEHADSYEILALTFTNKAANEMKERIQNMVGDKAKSMYIGTFHSIALRMLRNEGKSYTVYDTKDQEVLIKEILKQLNIDKKKYPPKLFLSRISQHKLSLKKPNEVASATPIESIVHRVYTLYESKLEELNALDFDNIIIKAIEMMQNSMEIRQKYSNRFKYIFIDEYQDTNTPQYEFVKLLYNGSNKICAVGDEDQSIYGFRGANVGNIMHFSKEYDNCKVVKLEKNYRSAQEILNVANSLISKNNFRNDKKLFSEKDGGFIDIISLPSDVDEAYFVAKKVLSLKESGERLSDMAVLYRTNFQSRIIEEYLVKHSIPYRIVGSKKFFDRKEIKDTLAYLRLLQNRNDDVSFLRAVESHPRGIGKKLIEKIQKEAQEQSKSYFEASMRLIENNQLTKKQFESLKKFIEIFDKLDINLPAGNLIDQVIEDSLYKNYLEESKEYGRMENIMELKNAAKDSKLFDFLESISLLDYSSDEEESQDVLNLMTIHASKGLEFNNVFIVGLEEGLFPNASLKDTELDMEEERRLLYVAITRAKEKLFITHAATRRKNNQTMPAKPSRFLDDINIAKKQISSKGSIVDTFKRGMSVKHSIYGKGVVLSTKTDGAATMLTVNFLKEGVKKILSKDKNLEII
jgi:DNA helicase-2/ATP-dependent DNA helicase PcrA